VRVSETGRKTFVLVARFPGSRNPTRRALGIYGELTLEKARAKARGWLELVERGVDPAEQAERQRLVEQRKRETSFAGVAEEFIAYIKRQKLRTADAMERRMRQTFIARWGKRPITEVISHDIRGVLREAVDRGSPYEAFHDFALIRRLFNWAIGTDEYGVEINPADRLNPTDVIGERHARNRVLTDDELRAFWRATERLSYPYGPLYRLLLLTGLRLGEACGAHWSEFDLERREWIIPASRMKTVRGNPKSHLVPLTDAMIEVLQSLPRFTGDFVFSNNLGKRPLKSGQFSDVKERLDKLILEELRTAAREPDRVKLPAFVNHDLRRSVRTRLSGLKVEEEVREAVLAHVRPGIKGVYDLYEYADEKRHALDLWAAQLRSIVEPPPTNVVALRTSGRASLA
jgi:integrase